MVEESNAQQLSFRIDISFGPQDHGMRLSLIKSPGLPFEITEVDAGVYGECARKLL